LKIEYGTLIEHAIAEISARLPADGIAPRARASLLLQGDVRERERLLRQKGDRETAFILETAAATRTHLNHSPHYYVTLALRTRVSQMVAECVHTPPRRTHWLRTALERLCTHPVTGYPLVALVLYFALYKFVGVFGAGTLVNFLEESVFKQTLIPWAIQGVHAVVPWVPLRDLLVGDYGIITLGLRYAVAIVLPIVGTFFLVFAVLEDTGYLARRDPPRAGLRLRHHGDAGHPHP
jgi:ferrous iron transport protein B